MRMNFVSKLFGLSSAKSVGNTMTSVSQKVSEIKSRRNLEKKSGRSFTIEIN